MQAADLLIDECTSDEVAGELARSTLLNSWMPSWCTNQVSLCGCSRSAERANERREGAAMSNAARSSVRAIRGAIGAQREGHQLKRELLSALQHALS
jgi:hypothetical protein